MDFINKVKLPFICNAFINDWELLDRETKADIIMRYIDNIELETFNNKYLVKNVNFRSTFYEDFDKLYKQGYIDKHKVLTYTLNGVSIDGLIRYSEYLPLQDVLQNFYRLNECYEVNLYKGTFYKETQKLNIGPFLKDEMPIRLFPLQKDDKNKDYINMGMLCTKNNPNDIKVNIKDLFETIPQEVTEKDFK